MAADPIEIVPGIFAGEGRPLFLIAGPCVIESMELITETAEKVKQISEKLSIPFIFKSSFDKANRSSIKSFRGPGLVDGLGMLSELKKKLDIPVLTDIHTPEQAAAAAKVVDIIQIPAFLSRQTDLLEAAAETGKTVNIKKGQFLAPEDVVNIVGKVKHFGGEKILITERGSSFGYRNLVVDMKGFPIMRTMGVPLVFDATHSVQLPGGLGDKTGGMRESVPTLLKAATAAGCDGIFLEVHPEPEKGLSDASNMWPLDQLESLLSDVCKIAEIVRK